MAKPRTASGYNLAQVAKVRATCLYVATKLGDLLDELVVVGGLAPSLPIDQEQAAERHVGTLDLDIGMEVVCGPGAFVVMKSLAFRSRGGCAGSPRSEQ